MFEYEYTFLQDYFNNIPEAERLPNVLLAHWMINVKSHVEVAGFLLQNGFEHYGTYLTSQDTLEVN